MQLKALRFFVKVATTASFTETALHFRVPTSSVSRHIAALERELGQQLLFRHTRAVRLTEAGERYYQQVRDALDQLDMAGEGIGGKDAEPTGLLRVNAPVALGRRHIAPLLVDFQQAHPAITLELTLTDAFIDPVQEGADITIRVGRLADSGLVAKSLGDQRYLACASPGYLDTHPSLSRPEELAAHNCLLYKGHQGAQRWYFRPSGEGPYRAFDVDGNLRSNNAESLLGAALAGQGIVLFPRWLYDRDVLRQGALVPVLDAWDASVDPQPTPIHLVHPESRQRSGKVQRVSRYLLERIGEPPYWDRFD